MQKPFKLQNGTILLSTEAPGGIYNAKQLKVIAAWIETDTAIVKVTEDQRLALFVKEDSAPTIAAQLKKVGLGIRHYRQGLHQPTACIGELCPDHKQDALGAAMTLSEELGELGPEQTLRIGINGCATCCVPCHTLDIAIIGDEGGYSVHLGGKNSRVPEMASFMAEGIPPAELPGKIKNIMELYKKDAQPGESLQNVLERVGAGRYLAALAPYSQDAASATPADIYEDMPSRDEDDDAPLPPLHIGEDLDSEDMLATDVPIHAEIGIEELSEDGPIDKLTPEELPASSWEDPSFSSGEAEMPSGLTESTEAPPWEEDSMGGLELEDAPPGDEYDPPRDPLEDSLLEPAESRAVDSIEESIDLESSPESLNLAGEDHAAQNYREDIAGQLDLEAQEAHHLPDEQEDVETTEDLPLGEEGEDISPVADSASTEDLLSVEFDEEDFASDVKTIQPSESSATLSGPSPADGAAHLELQGCSVQPNGILSLKFNKGLALHFQANQIKTSRNFLAGDTVLTIRREPTGQLRLEYEGISIELAVS